MLPTALLQPASHTNVAVTRNIQGGMNPGQAQKEVGNVIGEGTARKNLNPWTCTGTFLQFYNHSPKNPCNGQNARVMHRFDPEGGHHSRSINRASLRHSRCMHQAYLCCPVTYHGPRVLHPPKIPVHQLMSNAVGQY